MEAVVAAVEAELEKIRHDIEVTNEAIGRDSELLATLQSKESTLVEVLTALGQVETTEAVAVKPRRERTDPEEAYEEVKRAFDIMAGVPATLGEINGSLDYTDRTVKKAVDRLLAEGYVKDDTPDRKRGKKYSRIARHEDLADSVVRIRVGDLPEIPAEELSADLNREDELDHARMDNDGGPVIDLPMDPAEGKPITLDLDEPEAEPVVFRLED